MWKTFDQIEERYLNQIKPDKVLLVLKFETQKGNKTFPRTFFLNPDDLNSSEIKL